jgi:class 3 adenylate cyclase
VLDRLASFSRLILFDKRGTGMSDPVPLDALPTLEERMNDVRAVLDAVGCEQAVVFGFSEGGLMSVLFAATYPKRTTALVLYGVFAKRIWSPDYPWAPKPQARQHEIEELERNWSERMDLDKLAPSEDDAFKDRLATYFRRSASPGAAVALMRMNTQIDVRDVLPSIQAPTLVLHRRDDLDANVAEGRWIAEQIQGAKFVELAGDAHTLWAGDTDAIVDEIEEFITGARRGPEPDRVLATVLFTDIVGSTEQATKLGDRRWRELLERHHALVRQQLERFKGREVDTAGDGFLATFDGPARAIRCASAIENGVRAIGLEIRAGVHTGECEVFAEKVAGLAVHTGARVASQARPGEVLVSSTVKDLVAGSGIHFEDRGEHDLKGVGAWRLYSVVDA